MIKQYVYKGEFDDPFSEFFVKQKEDDD